MYSSSNGVHNDVRALPRDTNAKVQSTDEIMEGVRVPVQGCDAKVPQVNGLFDVNAHESERLFGVARALVHVLRKGGMRENVHTLRRDIGAKVTRLAELWKDVRTCGQSVEATAMRFCEVKAVSVHGKFPMGVLRSLLAMSADVFDGLVLTDEQPMLGGMCKVPRGVEYVYPAYEGLVLWTADAEKKRHRADLADAQVPPLQVEVVARAEVHKADPDEYQEAREEGVREHRRDAPEARSRRAPTAICAAMVCLVISIGSRYAVSRRVARGHVAIDVAGLEGLIAFIQIPFL